MLWLLRDARAPARLLSNFDAWIPLMLEAGRSRTGLDARDVLIEYMYGVVGSKRRAKLDVKLRKLGPGAKEAIMTIADMLEERGIAKGRVEGRVKGRVEGRVDGLRKLLRYKFRTLDPASEARLQNATPRAVDRYFRRVLTADSLAEVFEGRARRRAPRPPSRGARPARHRRAKPRGGR